MPQIPQEEFLRIIERVPIVCVDVAIYNHRNEVLLVKRRHDPARNRYWLPGGRVFKSETRWDAAKRKMKEECGISAEFLVELFTSETIFEDGPNGIPIHSVNTVYFTMIRDLPVHLDESSSEYLWLPPTEWLVKDLHPYVKRALQESSRLLV